MIFSTRYSLLALSSMFTVMVQLARYVVFPTGLLYVTYVHFNACVKDWRYWNIGCIIFYAGMLFMHFNSRHKFKFMSLSYCYSFSCCTVQDVLRDGEWLTERSWKDFGLIFDCLERWPKKWLPAIEKTYCLTHCTFMQKNKGQKQVKGLHYVKSVLNLTCTECSCIKINIIFLYYGLVSPVILVLLLKAQKQRCAELIKFTSLEINELRENSPGTGIINTIHYVHIQ